MPNFRLFIVRGLPGSGKTTLAEILSDGLPGLVETVCADTFFVEDGEYNFDPERLQDAHDWCKEKTRYALCSPRVGDVVVHNTVSRQREAKPYLKMARRYGYEPFVIETQNKFGSDHNVPRHVIRNMRKRWESLST